MQSLDSLFLSLALILVVAGVTTLIFKYLKQPLVLGYIVAGFLTGPNFRFFPTAIDLDAISVWGEIGVVFLLFALGLEFNIKKIKKVGVTGATTAITEALIMVSVGLLTGKLMGWSTMNSLFLGGMLSISSTSIIIKAFEDFKLGNKKFAQLVTGVLVFEDLVAILLLVLLSSIAIGNQFDGYEMLFEILKLLLFLTLWFTGGIFIVPTLLRKWSRFINDETLLVVSVGLCLGMVVMAANSGFSPALGAFIMGTIMAESDDSQRIHKVISPIRNLFAAVFFISVGMLVDFNIMIEYITPIIIITMIVLFIKPIAGTIGIMLSGQPMKHSMQAGFCLSQIGEFSFIIAGLGLSLNVIDSYMYPIIVTVSILTTFATPYFMKLAVPLYEKIYGLSPHKWQLMMDQYGSGSVTLNRDSDWKLLLRAYAIRIIVQSTWVTFVIFLSFKFMVPFAQGIFGNEFWIDFILSSITLTFASPFLYALMVKGVSKDIFDKLWLDRKYARGPLLTLRLSRIIIGSIFIGTILGRIFTFGLVLLIPLVVGVIFVIAFSRRLKDYYLSIEQQFYSNLDKTKKRSGIAIPKRIANDIHMEYIEIVIHSKVSGMTIREIHRQYHTGAQVISIIRLDKKINIPSNDEMLLAGDRVLVIGNDIQIQSFKDSSDVMPISKPHQSKMETELDLYKFTISEKSPLCGQNAHISELINKYDFLLVGYEHEQEAFVRPDHKYIFSCGDTIWVVGDKAKLMGIM